MGMFEWQQKFSVGITSIDGQHQNLFRIAGELEAAMKEGKGRQAVGGILDRLIQYTAVHFSHEERLMQQFGYPDYSAHKAEHDALTKKVIALQKDYHDRQMAITVELLQFLKDWLEHHISQSDQRYSPFLKAKAVA